MPMNRHYTAVLVGLYNISIVEAACSSFITLPAPRVNVRAESTSYLRIVSFIEMFRELLDRMNACDRYTESKCQFGIFCFLCLFFVK